MNYYLVLLQWTSKNVEIASIFFEKRICFTYGNVGKVKIYWF
jgi:hypothetical protein